MRFSKRTDWNTEESELARAHRLRVQAGLPIADLTASNPTRCGFQYNPQLLEALVDPKALDYDPQPLGSLAARQSICSYYSEHGVALDPGQIVLTVSTSEAYSFLFRLLCDAGARFWCRSRGIPSSTTSPRWTMYASGPCRSSTTRAGRSSRRDSEGRSRPRRGPSCWCIPNNPTGHFTKPWEARGTGAAVPGVRPLAHRGRGLSGLRDLGAAGQSFRRRVWKAFPSSS